MPLICPSSTVAWKPTQAAEREAALLRDLLEQHKIKRAYAAEVMGLDERDLNDQLRCVKPLNHYRLHDLFDKHPELADDYHKASLEPRGWRVMRDAILNEWTEAAREMKSLLPELRDLVSPRNRMVKASLELPAERKRA